MVLNQGALSPLRGFSDELGTFLVREQWDCRAGSGDRAAAENHTHTEPSSTAVNGLAPSPSSPEVGKPCFNFPA